MLRVVCLHTLSKAVEQDLEWVTTKMGLFAMARAFRWFLRSGQVQDVLIKVLPTQSRHSSSQWRECHLDLSAGLRQKRCGGSGSGERSEGLPGT